MKTFTLITEYLRPVAALVPADITVAQLDTIYSLLPERSCDQPELAQRWNVAHVLATADWSLQQRHRQPMLTPKGQTLAFL